jgi:hypothetical protein
MTYFHNITSLSDLKKQYRELVKNNHPDKGGDIAVMQAINNEFEQLYNIWKDRKETADTTGYANDYEGATAKQYTQHVYEEYGWTGSRRDRSYTRKELKVIFAKWLKETYKGCTFSISLSGYNSICVRLLKADFNPFKGDVKLKYSFSRYSITDDPELNDRAKEMFNNIESYLMSYNYDHSDLMTDYYDVGFYLDMVIGSGKTPFKVEIPKSRRASGACSAEFKYKEGPAHQAIKKALGKQYFADVVNYGLVLGSDYIYNDSVFFSANNYSAPKTMRKKMDKLLSVGIVTKAKYGCIVFVGYTPEVEKALADEDREKEEAFKAWQEEQHTGKKQETKRESTKEQPAHECNKEAEEIGAFKIVDYSEKAFAVVGDTREIKDILKQHGGRFNPSLTVDGSKCAGWIFSKKNLDAVRLALIGFTVDDIEVNQEQPAGQPEQSEKENNSTSYAEPENVLIFFESLGVLLDVLQELLTEQPKAEEKQPTPEDVAKVLELLPALLDDVCQILRANKQRKEPAAGDRKEIDNTTYNSVCTSVIGTGEYKAARQAIKQAVRQYRFTVPQLKYLLFIIHNHPGISRESVRDAA